MVGFLTAVECSAWVGTSPEGQRMCEVHQQGKACSKRYALVQEVTETYEKGEWIFWEPRLDEDGEGWCAHQTNSDFCFEYDHLCKA